MDAANRATPAPGVPPATYGALYRRDIDGLRAIAVLAVLAFHAFPTWLHGGFIGVDIFFVISGFLISRGIVSGMESGSFSIADFYSRRVRRIFPALLVLLLACIAFGWWALLAADFAQLGKHVLGGAGFSANLVLWQEAGYFDKASALKPLLHLWSLGIEEQFYFAWPLLMWIAWRAKWPYTVVMVVLAGMSFGVDVWGVHDYPTATFYSPLSRSWELIAGCILAQVDTGPDGIGGVRTRGARLQQLLDTKHVRSAVAGAGAALLLFGFVRLKSSFSYPGVWAVVPTLGSMLLIVAGPAAWFNRRILASRSMVGIGLISYPLYLWHWPLLTFARNAYSNDMTLAATMGLLVLAFVLAFLTYRYVEGPLRSWPYARLKVAALAAGMLGTAALGATVFVGKGLPSRYPEIVQHATEFDLEGYRKALRNGECFMDLGLTATSFAPGCVDGGRGPLWLVWGDSGAAALYPGFRSFAQERGIRLGQYTSSGCPPLIGFASTYNLACQGNNAWIIHKINDIHPDVVVLAAMWGDYDRSSLPDTVARLRTAGVGRIIIVGQAPAWSETPSHLVLRLWQAHPLHSLPPARLDYRLYGLDGGARTRDTDIVLRAQSAQLKVEFISLADALCNHEGCIIRANSHSGDAFYLDIVHLNARGSRFAVHAIAPALAAPE